MKPVLKFENVSKIYSRHPSRSFFHGYLMQKWRTAGKERFYALRNISFNVQHGQSLAVMGQNGAGKSTLLNLTAGLSEPNEGRITVNGKVAALLELGSGFHPDLTGLENLKIYAALLGLSRRQTMDRFDQILEFSGIGDFIGEHLRTYSSGMIMRLAFSVAIHVDADVLLVDEVLAVGDQAFQAKCAGKIREMKRAGKVFIWVSHVSPMVLEICDRAIWLDHGKLLREGPVEDVVEAYQASTMSPADA